MAKSSIEKYKSFEKWKTQEVENEFGLNFITEKNVFLEKILDQEIKIEFKEEIKELQQRLIRMEFAWNEFEYQTFFISKVLEIVNFETEKYRFFLYKDIKTSLKNKSIKGRVSIVLAQYWQIPKLPFFFIKMYKPLTNPNGDPLGQLLIEMIAAQALNNEPEQTLYGCYIIGRNWFFVVLQGKDYAVSFAYDATQNDIFDIVGILKKIKKLFEIKIGYVAEK